MNAPAYTTLEILQQGQQSVIGNYARQPIVMARGQGSWVWDVNGKRYLDLFAGFGGSILGHCHPALVAAVADQAGRLWHVGNTYWTLPQIEVAQRLNQHAFTGQAFFCHSGAEANEAACKLARLRGCRDGANRWKILSLSHSFHGRTLAMIAATGNPTYRKGFGPEVPGFINIPAGDIAAVEAAVDDQTAGILMEPIQGEGGVNVYPADYPARVRQLCDQRGLTLIFDEVWTGCGRTGRWFAHQYFTDSAGNSVEPDIMTLGKAVGGGLPVGIMYARPHIAALLVPSTHGCTLGGNPMCMAVTRTIFDVIERENLLAHAAALGEWATARLRQEPRLKGKITDVRGRGLMLGIELASPPDKFVEAMLGRGLMVNVTSQKVIRLAPAINIPQADWEAGINTLIEAMAAL